MSLDTDGTIISCTVTYYYGATMSTKRVLAEYRDVPIVTDELDKPAPKRKHNELRAEQKEREATFYRNWSTRNPECDELPQDTGC